MGKLKQKFNTQAIGRLGEVYIAYWLSIIFGVETMDISRNNKWYDVQVWPKKGTPFNKLSVITVKLRTTWDMVFPPNKEELKHLIKTAEDFGSELWIAFVDAIPKTYLIKGIYLMKAKEIKKFGKSIEGEQIERDWFKDNAEINVTIDSRRVQIRKPNFQKPL